MNGRGATDYLSVPEASERFGLTPNLIHNLVHRGRLPAARVRTGSAGPPRLYLDPEEIDRYLASRRRPATPEIRARIAADHAAGHGWSAIARLLNDDGIPAPGGRRWLHGTVRRIVQAAAY